jgi:hypothetical protein
MRTIVSELAQTRHICPGTFVRVDVVDQVLARLERIGELERGRAGRPELLGELRHLVQEAEAWARSEGDERARAAADKLRREVGGMR